MAPHDEGFELDELGPKRVARRQTTLGRCGRKNPLGNTRHDCGGSTSAEQLGGLRHFCANSMRTLAQRHFSCSTIRVRNSSHVLLRMVNTRDHAHAVGAGTWTPTGTGVGTGADWPGTVCRGKRAAIDGLKPCSFWTCHHSSCIFIRPFADYNHRVRA